jgi:hypothetical protein
MGQLVQGKSGGAAAGSGIDSLPEMRKSSKRVCKLDSSVLGNFTFGIFLKRRKCNVSVGKAE